MAVPDFQSFFKPLLDIAADGQEHSLKKAREKIAAHFKLTNEDLSEMLPSGTQRTFDNRAAWAKSYFVQAKVLNTTRRGYFEITDRGRDLLQQGHERIDIRILKQYPEFVEFHTASKSNKSSGGETGSVGTGSETPEEILQQAYQSIRNDLASELVARIKENSPSFFEKVVVDLMVVMGYGGSRADAADLLGKVVMKVLTVSSKRIGWGLT